MKAIQANEIRIGNLFLHTNENGTFNVVVKEVLESGINTHFNNGTWFIGLDNICPIPLTEEILIKAGFESHYHGFIRNERIFIEETLNGWNIGFFGITMREIDYLHELQNLIFALTGEEIKIDL